MERVYKLKNGLPKNFFKISINITVSPCTLRKKNSQEMEPWIFKHPCTCIIAGPTQSGKTFLMKQIIEYQKLLFFPTLSRICYCYSSWQDKFDEMKVLDPSITFHQGLIDIDEFDEKQNNLLILDDLMNNVKNDDSILKLFTVESHHKNISVFMITQNLFSQGKYTRTMSLNSHYLILLNNPRDKTQINYIARQMYPGKTAFLIEAYDDATDSEFGFYC
jgi:hypothetical protein